MALPTQPTRAGFLAFIRDIMGVPEDVLPDDSAYIDTSYELALEITNYVMTRISPVIYTQAVYNLGGSILLNITPDAGGAPDYRNELPYFAYWRSKFNLAGFVGGIIQSSQDNSTGQSMVVQEAAKNFTLANLQQLKDPYGRQYLAYMQSLGDAWNLV